MICCVRTNLGVILKRVRTIIVLRGNDERLLTALQQHEKME